MAYGSWTAAVATWEETIPCFGLQLKVRAKVDFAIERCQHKLYLCAVPTDRRAEAWLGDRQDEKMEAQILAVRFIDGVYYELGAVQEDRDF